MVCRKCGKDKDKKDFYYDKSHTAFLKPCKACRRQKFKDRYYRNHAESLEYARNKNNKYYRSGKYRSLEYKRRQVELALKNYHKNSIKHRARAKFHYKIRSGEIIRENCKICGSAKSEGHHYRGYSGTNCYKVIWLCRKHHMELHRKILTNP